VRSGQVRLLRRREVAVIWFGIAGLCFYVAWLEARVAHLERDLAEQRAATDAVAKCSRSP